MLRVFGALVFAALLSACASVSNIKPLTEEGIDQSEYAEDIARLKQESEWLHGEFKRKGLLYRDQQSNDYIRGLAQRIAPDLADSDVFINIYYVKNATPNAIALPNGDIYLFSGLMALVQNEDQLATVVAHEIGHVVHQHGLKGAINRRHTVVAAHITNIFLFGTSLAYLPAGASLASFSRNMEQEADQIGLTYMHAAGFSVNESVKVFERFGALPKANSIAGSIYSSHPKNQQRIEYLSQTIEEHYPQPHAKQASDGFEQIRARMVELNVKLRLRAKQYQMALDLLDEAQTYYDQNEKITYYRGEVYRLMAEYPESAAKERAWLQERSVREEDRQTFRDQVPENRGKALQLFSELEGSATAPMEVHRGLGLIYLAQENNAQAKQHLQVYLDQPTAPKDRLFIQHKLDSIQ